MRSPYESDLDDEGYLDDGDLPSLRPKGSYTGSVSSTNQDVMTNNRSHTEHRTFSHLDDEIVNNNLDKIALLMNKNNTIRNTTMRSGGGHFDDNDGPDDEMAARQATKGKSDEARPSKSFDTDTSTPTDNESRLSDEEVHDEERYEATLCGQTLNAINDICGGGIVAPSIEQPQQRKSISKSRSPKRDLPQGDIQQENTAIEVEYMEPITQTASVGSDDGTLSENTRRKNLRLNAIAKKAKEKFRSKKEKGKISTQSVGSNETSNAQMHLQQAIGSTADDDVTKNNKIESDDAPDVTNTKSSDILDHDYNNFNATEKRKFIKLINSGVVAAIASRQIINERNESKMTTSDQIQDIDDEDIVEVNDDDIDTADVEPKVELPVVNDGTDNIDNEIVDNSFSSTGAALPFKKSGSLYYDAVRREVDDSIETSRDVVDFNDGNNTGKTKGREFGVKQLLFGSGKPKGFAALQDTPEKKPPEGIMESGIASESNTIINPLVGMNKDVSNNTSFDSFVRNRVAEDATGNLSVENYQMTPTRELVAAPGQTTPQSATSTMIDSPSETVLSRSDVGNTTIDKLNDIGDSVLSTPSTEIDHASKELSSEENYASELADVSVTEDVEKSHNRSIPTTPSTFGTPNKDDRQRNVNTPSNVSPIDKPLHEVSRDITTEQSDVVRIEEPIQAVSRNNVTENIQERSDIPPVEEPTQDASRSIETEHAQEKLNSKEASVIFIDKPLDSSRIDINDDSNVNSTVDLSYYNDAVSVYTNATNLTGATTYTQSSRTRRPGVAKTRLAKQRELEQCAAVKPQGWHQTIRAVAKSNNRIWDPEKGWVDYSEPDIPSADVDNHKKDKIKIDLSKSLIHKESKNSITLNSDSGPAATVPFPQEWVQDRDSMIDRSLLNLSAIAHDEDTVDRYHLEGYVDGEGEEIDNELNVAAGTAERSVDETVDSDWVKSMRLASTAVAKNGMVWDPRFGWKRKDGKGLHLGNMENEQAAIIPRGTVNIPDTVDLDTPRVDETVVPGTVRSTVASKIPSWMLHRNPLDKTNTDSSDIGPAPLLPDNEPIVDDDGNVEFENLYNAASSAFETRSDVSNDDVIIVGDDEASRNVIEVVKQKVNSVDLELFPTLRNTTDRPVDVKQDQSAIGSIDGIAVPKLTVKSVDTSMASIDPSHGSSRRGAGPVDTDEVDETWDSDDDKRHSKKWNPEYQQNIVDLNDHQHIDGWKDNTNPATRYDANGRSVSSPANNSNRSARNVESTSPTTPSRRIPKLERSKRDTSPLSFRNPLEVAFPRSDESIRRHENIEIEYKNHVTDVHEDVTHKIIEEKVIESPTSRAGPVIRVEQSEKNQYGDSNIVRARLKEWESRIELSHSSDNGDLTEKSRNAALAPTAAAGWKSFLSKKVQAEKTYAESQQLKPISLVNDKKLIQYSETNEASALNLSDLSPIQAKDDISDDDIATSIGYGPTEEQRKSSSFFQRLTECAAPIIPSKSTTLCGRPDDEIVESESMADKSMTSATSSEKHRRTMSHGDEKPKSTSLPVTTSSSKPRTSASSVISDDFGAKTAFLDALAMKAAVSKPKRSSSSSSRRNDQSVAGSSIVSGTTDHSEKWKMFLERKKAASGTGPVGTSQSDVDVSRAAEKYAAAKVEEIMSKIAERSKTTPRNRDYRGEFLNSTPNAQHNPTTTASSIDSKSRPQQSVGADGTGGASITAAEDLAAARVEAMMAALVSSNNNTDEGEI